jgi:Putative transposase/Transposase zinc-binding domain
MTAIEICRTAELGGHVERCEDCAHTRVAYNSCRNRHCGKCQWSATATWLATREAELLPVPYLHVVFTLPAVIGAIAYQNKAKVYGLLFKAAAEGLLTIAAERKRRGADIGITAVLHTWGQKLDHHPHLHCIIPGGGLSADGKRWIPCKPQLFRPDRLSQRFRQLFLQYLTGAYKAGELQFFTDLIEFNDEAVFAAAVASLRTTEWVVYAKRPFMNANAILAYLARYTHRVAITNSRLLGLDETHVSFRWNDYRQGDRRKNRVTRMEIAEFIRRFLLHVLPNGFHRIRHYGILANGHRAEKLALCRSLLLAPAATPDRNSDDASESGISNHEACPCCGGRMRIMETFDGPFSRPYHVRRLDGL